MTLVSGKLNQTATYWAFNGVDSAGDPSFVAPIAVTVRWEDVTKVFVDSDGQERQSRAEVWADQDLTLNGFLLLGTSVAVDPTQVTTAYEIEAFKKIPSVSGDQFVRSATL